jgi:hypothetical protein
MTRDYALAHEDAFEHRAKQWEETCREIDYHRERPLSCETNCEATQADFQALFETAMQQSFLLGHSHIDQNRFLELNLEQFAKRGFDTLFLEGVPYEAQDLIDAYLASADEALPAELAMVLGSDGALVRLAKVVGIRPVGLECVQNYLPQPEPNLYRPKREAAMNDIGVRIIRKEKGVGKYVAHVGNDHLLLSEFHKTPGMGAVLHVPTVSVMDSYMPEGIGYRIISGTDHHLKTREGEKRFKENNPGTSIQYGGNPGFDVRVEVDIYRAPTWRIA